MTEFIHDVPQIAGVQLLNLKPYADERGVFNEVFRREWFPQVSWDRLQSNRSISKANVLRGLHYHFNQVDYWFVPQGRIRAGLADLRPSSPTYKASMTIDMDAGDNLGLFIPIGVAHGFYALTDCMLMYIVNNYYNNSDEFGVRWDDPELAVDWQLDHIPLLSERDRDNPKLADITADAMPQ